MNRIMNIKVVITDDHPIVANGLRHVLMRAPHISVEGIFHSAPELLTNISKLAPDVLILDKQLQETDALQTVQALLKEMPSLKILIFSSADAIFQVKKMLEMGCLGYILKDADDDLLVSAIESVYSGNRFLSPSLERALVDDIFNKKVRPQRNAMITKREKEILELIVKEYTTQEIASRIFLSPSTIELHRASLLQKLGVRNTAGLVRVAVESGLV
jgi:DNA-binding NarL/FixJ family response regulator